MAKKSPSIQTKLDKAVSINESTDDIHGNNYFSSKDQFYDFISEGALLNINKIASKALSIPSGEYMVWVTDVGHTMLIPVGSTQNESEVYENKTAQYEIETPKLFKHWNSIQIVLAEAEEGEAPTNNTPPEANQFKPDTSGIKRIAMYRAMQNQGYDQDYGALADKVGVQTPMISRILSGDRTPSMGTASRLCSALSSDPTALFPDIFDVRSKKNKPKKVRANRGSGMRGAAAGSRSKGKATEKWTQGSSTESTLTASHIIAELNSTINAPMIDAPATANASTANKQLQTDMEQQKAAQQKVLKPQIEQIKSDIDDLESGLEQGHKTSISSTNELEDMQGQVKNIDSLIDKITSAMG